MQSDKRIFDDLSKFLNGVAGTVDIDLSDSLQLKTITSWRHYKSDWAQDVDNSPIANQQLRQVLINDQ